MKMMLSMAALAAALILLAPAARAADGERGVIGGGFGVSLPTGTTNDELDSSWVLTGFGSWHLTGPISLRASTAYDRFRPNKEDRAACTAAGGDCKDRIGRIDGGVEVGPSGGGKTHPYGFFELGNYSLKEEVAVNGVKVSDSKSHLGGGFGGGVRHTLGGSWGVGGELPIRWWREKEAGNSQSYWYLEPNAFVFLHF